ncbi:hypothetical protein BaRGS_00035514 [Batillaria attramentaria]|uniref:Uncharacterized protein n=1 Tax=Batillaria attramentaria TaxID=370345 RepID=A0ABD0JE73_9CAEN
MLEHIRANSNLGHFDDVAQTVKTTADSRIDATIILADSTKHSHQSAEWTAQVVAASLSTSVWQKDRVKYCVKWGVKYGVKCGVKYGVIFADPRSCSVCSDVASRHHFVFRHVLKLEANKVGNMKDALCRCLQDFYKTINALMNDCGGLACLHLCQLCPMYLLDEVIDERLTTLIANDTPFEDNFERHIVDDRHIVYRVKPADYPAVSTLSFNSPIATNRDLLEPTQGQIRRIMQKVSTQRALNTPYNGDEEDKYPSSPILKYQQPVDLYPSCRVHLHGVDPSALHTVDDYGEAIAKYWWDELKLSHYIAALAKHQRGGSVYLGITEEKLPPSKAWKPVDDLDLGMVFQTKLKVWQDVEPGKQRVFYLAEDADVPESCAQPAGRYICQGRPTIGQATKIPTRRTAAADQERHEVGPRIPRRPPDPDILSLGARRALRTMCG